MQIVVHGLPWSVEWQDLKDLAKQHGDVLKADVVKRPDGKSRGFGTVTFKTPDDAQRAIQVPALAPCFHGETRRVLSSRRQLMAWSLARLHLEVDRMHVSSSRRRRCSGGKSALWQYVRQCLVLL